MNNVSDKKVFVIADMKPVELFTGRKLSPYGCGGTARITEYGVECEECELVLPTSPSMPRYEVIRRWNKIWSDYVERDDDYFPEAC